ncbi:MAG: hypothetical protein GY811_15185 [Myxococcales bacterium]|nr:hypothetical protein [Myxococcales bacterium]
MIAIRAFSILSGNTLFSLSCVVTSFMLGFSAGSFSVEKLLAWRSSFLIRRSLLFYGLAELGVGLFALLVLPLLFSQQLELIRAGLQLSDLLGPAGGNLLFALAILVLPTALMGAALPLIALRLPAREDIGWLYGSNLLGAAVGALAASFVLISTLGCNGAAGVVMLLNGAICICSIVLHRRLKASPKSASIIEAPGSGSDIKGGPLPRPLLYVLAFSSGVLFLAAEVLWTRLLSLILGNRVYVTSVTLCLLMLCLAGGAVLARWLSRRIGPLKIILGSYLAALLFILVGLWLKTPALAAMVSSPEASPAQRLGGPILLVVVSTVLPALLMATAMPTILMTPPEGSIAKGELIGKLLGINTLGSVLGALFSSYLLLHYVGTDGAWILLAALIVLMGFTVIWIAEDRKLDRMLAPILAPTALFLVLSASNFLGEFQSPYFSKEEVVVFSDDEHGVFQVIKDGKALRVYNNSTELVFDFGNRRTQYVQEMLARLPMLFATRATKVLDIGTGYGITAGAFSSYPQLEQIDTVEIVPAMIDNAHLFATGNRRYFENPQVKVHQADGRHFLVRAKTRYDVISVNVSDPYLPGSASHFSKEFYALVRSRLGPQGVFCQHLFGPDVAALVHGIARQFPHVRAVKSYANGLVVLASMEPLEPPEGDAIKPIADLVSQLDVYQPELFTQKLQEGDIEIASILQEEPQFINTDAHPVLEFRTAAGRLDLWSSNH